MSKVFQDIKLSLEQAINYEKVKPEIFYIEEKDLWAVKWLDPDDNAYWEQHFDCKINAEERYEDILNGDY